MELFQTIGLIDEMVSIILKFLDWSIYGNMEKIWWQICERVEEKISLHWLGAEGIQLDP